MQFIDHAEALVIYLLVIQLYLWSLLIQLYLSENRQFQ